MGVHGGLIIAAGIRGRDGGDPDWWNCGLMAVVLVG